MAYQKGIIYSFFSATSFAMTPLIIIKAYNQGASPWELIFTQSIIASCVLAIGLLVFAPQYLKATKKELKALAPIGMVGSLGTAIFYNLALQYISGGIATLLLYTYPVFVTIGAILIWKQNYTQKQLIALLSGVIGIGLAAQISVAGLKINGFGLLLGLLAALTCTVLNMYSEKALTSISPWKVTAYAQFGSTFGLLIIIGIFPNLIDISKIQPVYWLYGISIATVCSIIPTFLLMKGISYIGSSRASIISTAEIPITLLLVFIFLGERFTAVQLFGSTLVFVSILLLEMKVTK